MLDLSKVSRVIESQATPAPKTGALVIVLGNGWSHEPLNTGISNLKDSHVTHCETNGASDVSKSRVTPFRYQLSRVA